MNYFRCTVGGSGKGNTVVVTCASEFAGQTITLSKTGKTYTKTCPSTAPYVVTFYGVEAGTYTVSATVSGQTYSAEVVVQDVSCVLNYGFTWKLWVDTASQLDSSDYASLSEVLADEEAVRELFTEHACVDYMASVAASNADLETVIDNDLCAKWINNRDYALDYLGANVVIKALMDTADKYGYGEWVVVDDTTTPPTYGPKGNVPVMTANNAPYGVASASSETSSSYAAWKAFDDDTKGWIPNGGTFSIGTYLRYAFTNPIKALKAHVKFIYESQNRSFKYKIQGSNDGSTWTDVSTEQTLSTVGQDYDAYVDLTPSTYYLQYQLIATSADSNTSMLGIKLQFYGRELKVSVPTMTSNTAPYGEAILYGVAQQSYNIPYKVFDGTTSTWEGGSTSYSIGVGYHFVNPIIVKKFSFKDANPDSGYVQKATAVRISGSNDNSNWTPLFEDDSRTEQYTWSTYDIGNEDAFSYYKAEFKGGTQGMTGVIIQALQFYGLDYSEKEFEVGTTKKWLYDHGVELEELTKTANAYTDDPNPTVAPTFESNEIVLNTPPGSTCLVGTENVQDLSDYNLLRCFIRWELLGETKNGQMGVTSSKAWSSSVAQVLLTADSMLSNYPQIGLDISNVASGNIACRTYGQGEQRYTIQELWLE